MKSVQTDELKQFSDWVTKIPIYKIVFFSHLFFLDLIRSN